MYNILLYYINKYYNLDLIVNKKVVVVLLLLYYKYIIISYISL